MISGRRKACEEYTKGGLEVFSYRFDTTLVSGMLRYRFSGTDLLLVERNSYSGCSTLRQCGIQLP
jgi:hypothetical protein